MIRTSGNSKKKKIKNQIRNLKATGHRVIIYKVIKILI